MNETHIVADIFDYYPGNHGLTEEVIYGQQPTSPLDSVPIFSGSRNNEEPIGHVKRGAKNKDGDPIQYFEGPCIILTKDGSAGLLTYKPPGSYFTINHHACVLVVKSVWHERLNPEWFALQYQSLFRRVVTSKSDNRIFSTEWLLRLNIEVPDCETEQIPQLRKKQYLMAVGVKVTKLRAHIEQMIGAAITQSDNVPTSNTVISSVFFVTGGNSGLTKEVIYNNAPKKGIESLQVLTGATLEKKSMGWVAPDFTLTDDKKPRIISGECILITRKGFYAGSMLHHQDGQFVCNDDVYVLRLSPKWVGKVNLRWFMRQYAHLVRSTVTSRSDNATFNKTWLDRLTVSIPDDIEYQNKSVRRIEQLEPITSQMRILEAKIEFLVYQALEC